MLNIFLFFLYAILPILLVKLLHQTIPALLLYYLILLSILFYFFKKRASLKRQFEIKRQEIRENTNILKDDISRDNKNKESLLDKISRYYHLKDILVKLNQNFDIDAIAEDLVSISFSNIAKESGVCLLYLADKKERIHLGLFKSKKEDKDLVIKAKEGDIFDFWVLRHASPILIEDLKRDFRFDLEKLDRRHTRIFSSLISSPLMSESEFVGILRLDNHKPYFYSQDDLRFLATISDLSAVALENAQLFRRTEELAIKDGLTSFYRKEYFLGRLEEECKRAIRKNEFFSLLMLDIDHFKDYNDKFGHASGDIVLKSLSARIEESLRDYNPIIGRFGGEEFCVILPFADKEKAVRIAQDLRLSIEGMKIVLRRLENKITVSVGVATFLKDAPEAAELIFKADHAMYEAKRQGRNRVAYV